MVVVVVAVVVVLDCFFFSFLQVITLRRRDGDSPRRDFALRP